MELFVVLMRERPSEDQIWLNYFTAAESENPEQHFRQAVKEYLLTEDGMEEIEDTNEDFNWGDAMNSVPNEIWAKHGIKPVSKGRQFVMGEMVEIRVDQDEVLVPREYYDREEEE